MKYDNIKGVPVFDCEEFEPKRTKYCLCIPIINEGEKIHRQLNRAKLAGIDQVIDIVICDGGSTDDSTNHNSLIEKGVNTLLTKIGSGKQGAQLRMGFWWALQRGYEGVITIDGNDKDSIESVPLFIEKLEENYDFIQGSRYIDGGQAINTPWIRHFAVNWIHSPIISLCAKHRFTDTTNAFRGYSRRYLEDSRVLPFRDVFMTYELLAYLSVRASQLGMPVTEVPVTRSYPLTGKTPTKISPIKGNYLLFKILFKNLFGAYSPKG